MGCVVPLGLGRALARPDLRLVALDGDGAALMRMGAFAAVVAYGPPNLRHLLLDSGAHDSTGGQATVSAGTPDNLPRPSITPVDVKTRLMQHFGSSTGAR
jgi:phosphonopyruvate decarboxylase